jgi:hypothetical protein
MDNNNAGVKEITSVYLTITLVPDPDGSGGTIEEIVAVSTPAGVVPAMFIGGDAGRLAQMEDLAQKAADATGKKMLVVELSGRNVVKEVERRLVLPPK